LKSYDRSDIPIRPGVVVGPENLTSELTEIGGQAVDLGEPILGTGKDVWKQSVERDCQEVTLPTFFGGWQGYFLIATYVFSITYIFQRE
jgi:hypothetical protein